MLKRKLGKEKENKIAKCCWSLKMYEDWGMSRGSPGPCTLVTSLSSIQGPPPALLPSLTLSLSPTHPHFGGLVSSCYMGLYLSHKWAFFRSVTFHKISMFSLTVGTLFTYFFVNLHDPLTFRIGTASTFG